MKRLTLLMVSILAVFFLASTDASAQGLLNKFKKSKDKTEQKAESDDDDVEIDEADAKEASKDSVKKVKWDAVPTYKVVRVKLTDKAGNPIMNEDGTQATRVLLSDENGTYKGWEAVHEQNRQLDKAITNIILKMGGGAALGAVTGFLVSGGDWRGAVGGAVAGAGAGAILSKDDFKKAKALKKAMKAQKKELELYHKTYTDEGKPISASADLSHFENIEERTAVDSEIDAELASADFNTPDLSWKL